MNICARNYQYHMPLFLGNLCISMPLRYYTYKPNVLDVGALASTFKHTSGRNLYVLTIRGEG